MKLSLRIILGTSLAAFSLFWSSMVPVAADSSGLSGTISYSLDPGKVQSALTSMGFQHLPQEYYGAMLIHNPSVRLVRVSRKNDLGGMTVMIMSLDNPKALARQAKSISHIDGPGLFSPSDIKHLAQMCRHGNAYSVPTDGASIPVLVMSCRFFGSTSTTIEMATFLYEPHPIIVYGFNLRSSFDRNGFDGILSSLDSSQ